MSHVKWRSYADDDAHDFALVAFMLSAQAALPKARSVMEVILL